MQIRDFCLDQYLSYVNDYLTIETYAEHNGLRVKEAEEFLKFARTLLDVKHPEE